MSEFWIGASAATTVWLLVYGLAVAFWLWRDIHTRAAEMGCTEAANDRPFENPVLGECPYCGVGRPTYPHRKDCMMVTPTMENFGVMKYGKP